MQVPHINASEYSSPLTLPTVRAQNGQNRNNKIWARDASKPQNLENALAVTVPNLPTPTVSDQYTANLSSTQQKPGSLHSVTLAQVFHKLELFMTPVASEGTKAPSQQTSNVKGKTGQIWLSNQAKDISLLATPQVDDGKNTGHNQARRLTLASQVWAEKQEQLKLFPTLRASDSYERRNQKTMDRIARDGGDMTMTTLARTTTDWGKFEPAIRRWESILGRPAPEPTKPDGKDNNHRLSSKFTEWMMGLPDGWITGHDLKRNDELKLAGNGVVPQQAELALRLLLDLPKERER